MTFIELILFLSGREEEILAHRVNEIITKQNRYHRVGNNLFTKDTEEGAPDIVWGRGGASYIWKKKLEQTLENLVFGNIDDKTMGLIPKIEDTSL